MTPRRQAGGLTHWREQSGAASGGGDVHVTLQVTSRFCSVFFWGVCFRNRALHCQETVPTRHNVLFLKNMKLNSACPPPPPPPPVQMTSFPALYNLDIFYFYFHFKQSDFWQNGRHGVILLDSSIYSTVLRRHITFLSCGLKSRSVSTA